MIFGVLMVFCGVFGIVAVLFGFAELYRSVSQSALTGGGVE